MTDTEKRDKLAKWLCEMIGRIFDCLPDKWDGGEDHYHKEMFFKQADALMPVVEKLESMQQFNVEMVPICDRTKGESVFCKSVCPKCTLCPQLKDWEEVKKPTRAKEALAILGLVKEGE